MRKKYIVIDVTTAAKTKAAVMLKAIVKHPSMVAITSWPACIAEMRGVGSS
jgi:hypothetical protein